MIRQLPQLPRQMDTQQPLSWQFGTLPYQQVQHPTLRKPNNHRLRASFFKFLSDFHFLLFLLVRQGGSLFSSLFSSSIFFCLILFFFAFSFLIFFFLLLFLICLSYNPADSTFVLVSWLLFVYQIFKIELIIHNHVE